MATELGVAYLSIVSSTKGLGKDVQKQFGAIESSASQTGKRSGGLFSGAFKGAIGILGGLAVVGKVADFLRDANAEARESQKVNAITANAIKKTGGAAKVTAEQVGDLATAISNKTGIDDEAIQQSANLLLTFKNVRNEVGKGANIFDRATAAAQDMAAAGFGDADSAAKMLGKALNDPVKGLTAMGRAGVTFSKEQQDRIKQYVKEGDLLSAQQMIMKEVESQVGGAAEASATATEKLATKWGNFKELFGEKLVLPAVDAIAPMLSGVIDRLSAGLGPAIEGVQKWMAPIAATVAGVFAGLNLSAVAGPVIQVASAFSPLGLVVKSLAPLLPQLAEGFASLAQQGLAIIVPLLQQVGPIFGKVAETLVAAGTQIASALIPVVLDLAQNLLPLVGQVIGAVVPVVGQLVQAFLPIIPMFAGLVTSLLPPLVSLIKGLIPAIMPLVSAALGLVQALMPVVGIVISLVQALLPPLMAAISSLVPPITEVVSQIAGALVPVFGAVGDLVGALMPIIAGLAQVIASIVAAVLPVVAVIAGRLIKVIGSLIAWVANAAAGIVKFVAGAIGGIAKFASGVSEKIGEVIGWFKGLPGRLVGALGNVGSLLFNAGKNILQGFLRGLKSMWDNVTGWVSGIGDWIAQNKGPKAYDLALLVPAGRWIMTGLQRGLEAEIPNLRATLGMVSAEMTGVSGSLVAGGAATAGGGRTVIQNITGVDAAEVAARTKAAWQHELGGMAVQT